MMGIRTHLQASNDLLTSASAAGDVQQYIKAIYAQGLRPRDAAKQNAEKAKVDAAESKARRRAG